MKLNYKRTFLVGLAFLSISAFWQMYDGITPKILTGTFNISETLSGTIMAMDNVLALFLLPFFGSLSDKVNTRIGRRMPFILGGTAVAVVLMLGLPLIDNSYAASPAPWKLIVFIVLLGLLLIAMGTYRSPAVALMPDVTPKALRSKGNAIINLMGAAGGILYLLVSGVLYSKSRIGDAAHVDYFLLYAVVAAIMVVSVAVLFLTIKENKLTAEARALSEPEEDVHEPTGDKKKLPRDVRKSLIFVLLSVALWYVGYNGITTWFTSYAANVWDMALGQASMCLTVGMAGAIISYMPIGIIASKVGRKRTIMAGVTLLASSFAAAFVVTLLCSEFTPVLYVLFGLVGLAWAAINVNSLPMVVEMCRGSDIGKFTGYYYTFSMAAQIVTPVVAGWLIRTIGYKALFPYSTVFVLIALFTMSRVKHGDNRPEAKKGIEALDVED